MRLEEFKEMGLKVGDSLEIKTDYEDRNNSGQNMVYKGVYTELRTEGAMFRQPFIFIRRNAKYLGEVGVPLKDIISIDKQ